MMMRRWRTVTRRILEHERITVLLAADGVEGIRVYAENPGIDVVLLDMTMPRMDGEQTFRELRKAYPGVRVVLMSGYNEQDATEQFAGKGLAGFIQKPYRPAELIAKIDAALGDLYQLESWGFAGEGPHPRPLSRANSTS